MSAILTLGLTSCAPADPKPEKKIIMLGDSITNRINLFTTWDSLLNYSNIQKIAFDGFQTQHLLFAFNTNCPVNQVINEAPDIVYLMAGINDAHQNVPLSTTMTYMRRICDSFDTHGIQVVIQSVLPTTDYYDTLWGGFPQNGILAGRSAIMNDSLIILCQDRSYEFLELRPFLTVNTNGVDFLDSLCSTDGIHLNLDGYNNWSTPLYQSIQNNQ